MQPDFLEPLSKYRIKRQRFKQGDALDFEVEPLSRANLIFVRSGSIEIFERAYCIEFHAYRPVAIFGEGSMFGLFDLMDRYCGIPTLNREKENWEIAAGRGSSLLLRSAPDDVISEMYCDSLGTDRWDKKSGVFEPSDLLDILLDSIPIEIELFEFDPGTVMRDYPQIFDAVVRACWISAQEYRLSRNLYNQGFYDAIFTLVMRDIERESSTKASLWKRMGNIPGKDTLIPEIIFATIEALERPALNNPMFFKKMSYSGQPTSDEKLEQFAHLNLSTVLHAYHPRAAATDVLLEKDMYYPLGFQNLSINRFLATRYDFIKNTEAAGKLKTFFNPTPRGIGNEQQRPFIEVLYFVIHHFKREYIKRRLSYPFHVEARLEATGGKGRFIPLLVARRLER